MIKISKSFQFWIPVKGYEGFYEISIIGIRSVYRKVERQGHLMTVKEKMLTPVLGKIGYFVITLTVLNKSKLCYYHRLRASHFIYNPYPERKFINHKNGNKLDIRICNLEWATQAENNKHAYDSGLRNGDHKRKERRGLHACAKKVGMFDGELLIKTFDCKMDAEEASGRTVWHFIKNKRRDPDGFFWQYV